MQGFELRYSRSDAIRTRTIIRDALAGVIEAGSRGKTEWNVEVVMASNEEQPIKARYQCRHSYRRRKKADT